MSTGSEEYGDQCARKFVISFFLSFDLTYTLIMEFLGNALSTLVAFEKKSVEEIRNEFVAVIRMSKVLFRSSICPCLGKRSKTGIRRRTSVSFFSESNFISLWIHDEVRRKQFVNCSCRSSISSSNWTRSSARTMIRQLRGKTDLERHSFTFDCHSEVNRSN